MRHGVRRVIVYAFPAEKDGIPMASNPTQVNGIITYSSNSRIHLHDKHAYTNQSNGLCNRIDGEVSSGMRT